MRFLLITTLLSLASTTGVAAAQAPAEHWQASYVAEASGDYPGALREHLAVEGPTRSAYLFHLRHGWLLYMNAQYTDAIGAYRRASAAARGSVEARLGLMLPLLALRRYREVVAVAADVRQIDPHNATAQRRLAFALFSLGRFDEAKARYEAVLEKWPGDLEMRSGVGWCQLRLGQNREAAATFAEVLAVSPRDASALEGARLANGAAH